MHPTYPRLSVKSQFLPMALLRVSEWDLFDDAQFRSSAVGENSKIVQRFSLFIRSERRLEGTNQSKDCSDAIRTPFLKPLRSSLAAVQALLGHREFVQTRKHQWPLAELKANNISLSWSLKTAICYLILDVSTSPWSEKA